MPAVLKKPAEGWTYQKYATLDDTRRYEIIEGALLLMEPAPDTWHQDWLGKFHLLLDRHIRAHGLGRVLLAPVDVVLDQENTLQPDLVFVATANLNIIQRAAIFGVPNLLVELISPSSVRRDRYDKKALYARFGVQEYWIGDPANRALEILTLRSGAYELHCCAGERGRLTSSVLPGLGFDLSEIQ